MLDRRKFFKRIAPVAAATPFALHGMRLQGLAKRNFLYEGLSLLGETDRVLVIIQLVGGNDGLNTVVPVEEDAYYNARPTLAVPKGSALPLDGEPLLGMNPVMEGMARMFNQGTMAIVQNLGYDRMNLSHFAGTEIWNTASGGTKDSYLETGWIGRYLQREFPDFPDVLPGDPPAIEISPATSSVFTVFGASIGMSLTDPEEFHQLVGAGPNVSDQADPGTLAGREWEFIDSINRQSITFADTVRGAALRAANRVPYPDTDFARSLAIVAQLVAGGLGTRVYKVSLGNFDTHGNQEAVHPVLLRTLSEGIAAFQADLAALGVDHRVTGMTYSEFGRRVSENGAGTDHGTAAPHFVFGGMVNGGNVFGGHPDLSGIDAYGNLPHTLDFHCYYASVIAPLFGIGDAELRDILPLSLCDRPDFIPLYRTSGIERTGAGKAILSVAPNPAGDLLQIFLPDSLHGIELGVTVVNGAGETMRKLSVPNAPGILPVDVSSLPNGPYTVILHTKERRTNERREGGSAIVRFIVRR